MAMALTPIKFAVYYGTITLKDGSSATYSAADIASLYNVADLPYLAVSLTGPSPFKPGRDELEYMPLKPQADPGLYYDAKEKYNYADVEYWDDDFDAHAGGKWTIRPRQPDPDAT